MAVIELVGVTPVLASVPTFPSGAIAITPSADTFSVPVQVYVGGAGNVTVMPANGGSQVTFFGLQAGQAVPCKALAVLATGTTATNLVAVY